MGNAPMYGLKMPAKYWDLVSMYRGSLGPLKGWGALANYLLANCDHFTSQDAKVDLKPLIVSVIPIYSFSEAE